MQLPCKKFVLATMQVERSVEEKSSKGQKACDLPDDFTVNGNLLDADAEIHGLPAPRLSKFRVILEPATAGCAVEYSAPCSAAKLYRDPEGVHP